IASVTGSLEKYGESEKSVTLSSASAAASAGDNAFSTTRQRRSVPRMPSGKTSGGPPGSIYDQTSPPLLDTQNSASTFANASSKTASSDIVPIGSASASTRSDAAAAVSCTTGAPPDGAPTLRYNRFMRGRASSSS